MGICINICDETLDLQYEVLQTGTYTVTIVSALKERFVAALPLTAGDNLILDPMPSLNESMAFTAYVSVDGGLEEVIYFTTYPYQTVLVTP